MPRRKLSDAFLQRVKKPGRGQVDYFDASFPGFAIRVSATGARAWTLHTRIDGKQARLSLGRYPALSLRAARQKAGAALELIEAGKDPRAEAERERQTAARQRADTVRAVAERFLADIGSH